MDCSGATQTITIAEGDPGSEELSKAEAVNATSYKRRSKTYTFAGVLWGPGMRKQRYTVTCLKLDGWYRTGSRASVHSATLVLEIKTGTGQSSASYDVYPPGVPIPTEGRPRGSIRGTYDVRPGRTRTMRIKLGKHPQRALRFGATGNWFSEEGLNNTYEVKAYVEYGVTFWKQTPTGQLGIRG
ncbi:MAG: hypothetical protein AAF674_18125 [Pseudomonadota bacterium]